MLLHRLLAVIALLALPLVSHADIAIHVTRLVHEGSEGMVVQRVWNKGDKPSLIQAWVDDGDRNRPLSSAGLPFFATPPLFQLEPGRNRDISVRLVDAAALPTDRESLYWLNVLDLPASEKVSDTLNMAYAVRWRVKLFHRPSGLAGTPETAAAKLAWRRLPGAGGGQQVSARNDTPYHVSLRELNLAGVPVELPPDQMVIAPYSEWSMAIPDAAPTGRAQLRAIWLDDKGEAHTLEATLD